MRALAIQRWLWGLLFIALLVAPGRGLGRGLPKTAPGSPPAAPSAPPEVHVAPFTAPTAMPALGAELARALHAALREANVPARLGKGEEGSALSGRLEELSQTQVRLYASYRGHTVQSVGDLEHLDDLVYAVFTQLRPWLQAAADTAEPRSGVTPTGAPAGPGEAVAAVGPAAAGSPPATDSPAAGTTDSPAGAGAAAAAKDAPTAASHGTGSKDAGRAGGGHRIADAHSPAGGKKSSPIIPASVSAGSASPLAKDSNKDGNKDGNKDDGKGGKDDGRAAPDAFASLSRPAESSGTSLGTGPGPEAAPPTGTSYPGPPKAPPPLPRPPVAQPSPYGPYATDPRRPRVAVHVVGEPLARVPPGFYGLGPVGQQTLLSYLQQRWHIPAVGSRLVGLTGGLAALDQSLRLGARHTLMARLDSLVLSASPTASPGLGPGPGPLGGSGGIGGTLSGRLHVVLLYDGKLLFDRSVMMPPTLILSSETPAQAYSRILFAALDSVAGELYARLVQPPPG